jgi:hypothetical protein
MNGSFPIDSVMVFGAAPHLRVGEVPLRLRLRRAVSLVRDAMLRKRRRVLRRWLLVVVPLFVLGRGQRLRLCLQLGLGRANPGEPAPGVAQVDPAPHLTSPQPGLGRGAIPLVLPKRLTPTSS